MMNIQLNNVGFKYDSEYVLKNCSFDLDKITTYALLGANGCGKTTLIKLLTKIIEPQLGEILVGAENILSIARRDLARIISYVPQAFEGTFAISVLEMTVLGRNPYLRLFQKPSKRDYDIAKEALNSIGIYHLAQRNFLELSGGERQLVLIARAITQESEVMILDEPTSHLDFKNQYMIMKSINDIVNSRNLTILISIHDPNLAVRFCDRGIMLMDGKVFQNGMMDKIMTEDNLSRLYNIPIRVVNDLEGNKFITVSGFDHERAMDLKQASVSVIKGV